MSTKKKPSQPAQSLPRQPCNCQASVHPLINNCTSCGKIVCEKENIGPCLFCGNEVLKRPQPGEITKNTQLFDDISQDLEFKKAEDLKNRLLQYDASQIAETNVIDEQTDWFEINENVWSSKEAKTLASKKIEAENAIKEDIVNSTYISFDGKGFIEDKKTFDSMQSKKEAQQFDMENRTKEREKNAEKILKKSDSINADLKGDEKLRNENREIFEGVKHEFSEKYKDYVSNKEKTKSELHRKQVQDKIENLRRTFNEDENYDSFLAVMDEATADDQKEEYYDSELYPDTPDKGKCLSMLQPWASLLIEGFKRFEGRFWTTEYRGHLWIHAGATPPTPETVRFVEAEYEELYKNAENKPNFPERYPLGSLLGVIDLQTVLKRRTYNEVIPEEYREKSESEHIFVIRNPRKLLYPIKMPGSKDIYDLPPKIKEIAMKCLKKVKTNWWEYYAKNINNIRYIQEESVEEEVEEKREEGDIIEEVKEIVVEKKEVVEEKNEKKKFVKRNLKIKTEKFGFSINDFFDEDNLKDISEILDEKCGDMKNFNYKNPCMVNFDVYFPFYEEILELLMKQKKNFKTKFLKSAFFCINKKQKSFEFPQKYKILLNIGVGVSLTLIFEGKDETGQIELAGGSFYFIPDKSKLIYQNSRENLPGKKKNLKGDYVNMFVLFSEGY